MRKLAVLAMLICLAATSVAQDTVIVVPGIDMEQIKTALTQTRRQCFEIGMDLKDPYRDAFWSVYTEFEKEKQELDNKRFAVMNDYASKKDQLTNEQAIQLANQAADIAKKEVDLRKKYANKLNKKVSGGVGARFYQIDAYITTAMTLDILDNMDLVGSR
jgi:hypothetical protein